MNLNAIKSRQCPKCSSPLTFSMLDGVYDCVKSGCGFKMTQERVEEIIRSNHASFSDRPKMSEEGRLSELNNFGRKAYSLDYSDDYGKEA